MSLIQAVIANARGEIGVRENYVKGVGYTNRGRRVDEYQRADLLPGLGYAWCASFVAWNLLDVLGKDLCDLVWLRSASCDSILYWARKKGIVSTQPAAGCAGLCMASKNDATHIFLVDDVLSNACKTIEGNTNGDGSREGNGVYGRVRRFSSRYLYVHWMNLLPVGATPPAVPPALPVAPASAPFAPTWEVWGTAKICDAPLIDGRVWIPAWKWAHWFGMKIGWNMEAQAVTLNGREVPGQVRLVADETGLRRAWCGVRDLVAVSPGLSLQDQPGKVVVMRHA